MTPPRVSHFGCRRLPQLSIPQALRVLVLVILVVNCCVDTSGAPPGGRSAATGPQLSRGAGVVPVQFVGWHRQARNNGGTSAELEQPEGLAVDAAGNLYIADPTSRNIRLVTAGGTIYDRGRLRWLLG
jgi:hypothetical protein